MLRLLPLAALLCLVSCGPTEPAGPATYEIGHNELDQKIRGAWAARLAATPEDWQWTTNMTVAMLEQVRKNRGSAEPEQLATLLTYVETPGNHGYGTARRNLHRDLGPRESGALEHNIHATDFSFPATIAWAGLIHSGMPYDAAAVARRAAPLVASGDGAYAGMFVAALYAAAFVEPDPAKLVEAAEASVPAPWFVSEALDPGVRETGFCAPSAASYTAQLVRALANGGGDFVRTVALAGPAAPDAAALLGVTRGYDALPVEWQSAYQAALSQPVPATQLTWRTVSETTLQGAIEQIQLLGGQFLGDRVVIEPQTPSTNLEPPPPAPQVAGRIPVSDERWMWRGAWNGRGETTRVASVKGATAEITFSGTGFVVAGPYIPDGGKLDIQIDAEPAVTVDAASIDGREHPHQSLDHRLDLAEGSHTVRITVRGERAGSGTTVPIEELVVYR